MIQKMVLHPSGECDIIINRLHIKLFEFDKDLLIQSNHDVLANIIYSNIIYAFKDEKRFVESIKKYLKDNKDSIEVKKSLLIEWVCKDCKEPSGCSCKLEEDDIPTRCIVGGGECSWKEVEVKTDVFEQKS